MDSYNLVMGPGLWLPVLVSLNDIISTNVETIKNNETMISGKDTINKIKEFAKKIFTWRELLLKF